eukprot:767221-Hanusia_phi.AAC.1
MPRPSNDLFARFKLEEYYFSDAEVVACGNCVFDRFDGELRRKTGCDWGCRNLQLDNMRLSTIAAEVFDGLSNVTIINLSNKQLTTLQASVFESLSWSFVKDLSSNQLTRLSAGTFDRSLLIFLYLSNNRLTCISHRRNNFWHIALFGRFGTQNVERALCSSPLAVHWSRSDLLLDRFFSDCLKSEIDIMTTIIRFNLSF